MGKVISEITFGFWPKLFAHSYHSFWWDTRHRRLGTVLPYHPNIARDTRGKFQERLEYFVALRNRMMHQEAIFEGIRALNRPVLSIDILHAQLVETIGWVNLDVQKLVARFDRFDSVFSPNGKSQIEHGLMTAFNLPVR